MAVNYTDKDSITIDDINNTPITVGHDYTFGNVFGALNKIIKAIINKFKNVDSEIITLHQGKIGSASWSINVTPGQTVSKTITVDSSNYFTHGYIYTRRNIDSNTAGYTLNHITQMQSVISTGLHGENVNTSSKPRYGEANITYTIIHENNGTYIKIEVTNTGTVYDFKYSNFDFKYELY